MKKQSFTFSLIIFAVLFFIVMSMTFTHVKIAKYKVNDNDIVKTVRSNEAVEILEDEKVFQLPQGYTTKYVVVKLDKNYDESRYIDFSIVDDKDNYKHYYPIVSYNTPYIIFETDEEGYEKFVFTSECPLAEIQFHSEKPVIEEENVKPHYLLMAGSIIIAIIISIAMYLADLKYNLYSGIKNVVKHYYKKVLLTLFIFLIISICCYFLEKLFSVIFKRKFLLQRAEFYAAIGCIIAFAYLCRKVIDRRLEILTAGIIVITGIFMVVSTPATHNSWDIDSHYLWAFTDSCMSSGYMTQTEYGIWIARYLYSPGEDYYINTNNEMNRQYHYIVGEFRDISIPHLFAGAGIAVARFMYMPFVWVYRAGEIAQVLLYALLIYLAVRRLHSGKVILSLIAMFPTCIYLASQYSYDYWVNGFMFLGLAYFYGNLQEKEGHISKADTIIMVLSMTLACLPKQIYVTLMLIPFLMPRKKIKDKKKYYLICASGFALLMAMFLIRSFGSVSGSGDTRFTTEVNPGEQIAFIFNDLGAYLIRLFREVESYTSLLNFGGYALNFAYMGANIRFISAFVTILIAAVFTDKDECDDYFNLTIIRIYSILLYIGMSALMITAFYISYTAVGSSVFAGCQPRYIIPLLYPLLATIGSGKIRNNMNKKWYNLIIIGAYTFFIYFTIKDVFILNLM